jgi:signal transduction histidine kinase
MVVRTDMRALRQILINLVSNAIKFTDRGGIAISGRLATGTDGPCLEVAVSDSGSGIAATDLPKLFSKFGRLHSAEQAVAGGTGLGLYLSRLLAQRLGGTITVESEVGRGSCFTVRFPVDGRQVIDEREPGRLRGLRRTVQFSTAVQGPPCLH